MKLNPDCPFEVHVGVFKECSDREFNYLDYLFYWDSEAYSEICKFCSIENPSPSQLMTELDKWKGKAVKVVVDDTEIEGTFDLTEDYRIIVKIGNKNSNE